MRKTHGAIAADLTVECLKKKKKKLLFNQEGRKKALHSRVSGQDTQAVQP